MNRIDGVALDLDGTLLDRGGMIVDEAKAALTEAHARGVLVFIVTGRPFQDIIGFLEQNDLMVGPVPHAFAAEERDVYQRVGGEFQPESERNRRLYEGEYQMSLTLTPAIEALFPALAACDPEFHCSEADVVCRRGFIELRFGSRETAAEGVELLQKALADATPTPGIIRNQRGVSIRHPASGKGNALARLAAAYGLSPERVLAVGDSENDRSMLDGRCGFLAAAPANADASILQVVRERGGFLCSEPRGRGVAEAIRAALA